tara:strand:+ start:6469 stop:7281 length:813 start_codon:yes stop_codon:yes gene_type:complete
MSPTIFLSVDLYESMDYPFETEDREYEGRHCKHRTPVHVGAMSMQGLTLHKRVVRSCVPGEAPGRPVQSSQLWSKGANVHHAQDLLTPGEARYLIEAADVSGSCKRSKVLKPGGSRESDVRTSTSCFLKKAGDPVIECIERKVATYAGKDVANLEPLQVTKYAKGQQYKPHYDWFQHRKKGDAQRTATVFAYLQECGGTECGGATVFSELKQDGKPLRVYPKVGAAVYFDNLTPDGRGNKLTRHGGEPVLCDRRQKIGLNCWFRDKPWPR